MKSVFVVAVYRICKLMLLSCWPGTYAFVYRMSVCLLLVKKLAFHELFNDALSTVVLDNDGRDLPRLI